MIFAVLKVWIMSPLGYTVLVFFYIDTKYF